MSKSSSYLQRQLAEINTRIARTKKFITRLQREITTDEAALAETLEFLKRVKTPQLREVVRGGATDLRDSVRTSRFELVDERRTLREQEGVRQDILAEMKAK